MGPLPDDIVTRIQDYYRSANSTEKIYLKQILSELSAYGDSETYRNIWLSDYSEIPVSINTFLNDEAFLGKVTRGGTAIYPRWRTAMQDVFNAGNKYEEVVLSGATRIGKTSTGITMTAYMLYKLMCLKDPQQFFNKKDVSQFSITFFNITKDMAKGVAFREFNDTLKASPWFCAHGRFSKSEQNFYYIPDGNKIVIDYGSDSSHGLGKQLFCAFMDEVNFGKAGVKDVKKAKEHMKELYDTVSTRIKGTFRQNGEVYGKLFAISSKKSDSDFMEYYIASKRKAGEDKHMFIFDKPQWEVLPKSMFSEGTFYIAVGSKHQKGFVVPKEQSTELGLRAIRDQGFVILEAPIDVRGDFLTDFDVALRDIAGISVPGTLSFINADVVKYCMRKKCKNLFIVTSITMGFRDTYLVEDFIDVNVADPADKKRPMYIHLDLSLTGDETGIGGVWVSGRKDVRDKDGKTVSAIMFRQAFGATIAAPRGDQIPFNKIVNFIIWLRRQGFYIAGVSRDSYQSEYLGQQLRQAGFDDNKISLDRTPDGYLAFRSVLLEDRIELCESEELEDQLIHLQRDSFSGKVDHPIEGKKDLADGVAGAVWNAILKNPSVPVQATAKANAAKAVNARKVNNNRPGSTLPAMNLNPMQNRRH